MTERIEMLTAALEEVHLLLARADIWHCLAYGTLLGAVRGGALIEWDHDIDLQIRPHDIPRVLALGRDAGPGGLRFQVSHGDAGALALNPGRVVAFDGQHLAILRGGIAVGELWAPSLFADGVLRLHDFEHEVALWPESSFPHHFVQALATARVGEREYPVPRDAERLLEGLYGTDWSTPRRAEADGGEARPGHTVHGTRATPSLAAQVAWCEQQGWDRSAYAGEPAWPRALNAAGPTARSERTAASSGSSWWHTLEELGAQH